MAVTTIQRVREFFVPPSVHQNPSPPEFDTKSASQTIRAAKGAADEQKKLRGEERNALVAFREAEAAYHDEIDRIRNRERELSCLIEKAKRAETLLLRLSKPTDEEEQLESHGKELTRKAMEMRSRYRIHAVEMLVPEEHEDAKSLASLEQEIADCETAIKRQHDGNPGRWSGCSVADNRLKKLLTEKGDLQARIDQYQLGYERWQEIQVAKEEARKCFAERDRLRREREETVIAKALKTTK